jgi:anti-sigma factor RsiW
MVSDNRRAEQLMQQALDGDLEPKQAIEFNQLLRDDPEQAKAYDAQQQVDNLLSYPPMERAPKRLGMAIMARIAQAMTAQKAVKSSPLTEAQIRVAVQLVTAMTLPILSAAGYLLLNAQSNPKLLERLLMPVVGLLVLVIDAMTAMLEQVEKVYEDDPELALAILTLIPSMLLVLTQEILEKDYDA